MPIEAAVEIQDIASSRMLAKTQLGVKLPRITCVAEKHVPASLTTFLAPFMSHHR
jgi:hypothetical protein